MKIAIAAATGQPGDYRSSAADGFLDQGQGVDQRNLLHDRFAGGEDVSPPSGGGQLFRKCFLSSL